MNVLDVTELYTLTDYNGTFYVTYSLLQEKMKGNASELTRLPEFVFSVLRSLS